MGDVVAITSGKGGVGKSTLAAAAGLNLARAGQTVCLIDMDMGLRSLDIMLGLENKVVFDLADVAEGMCRVRQALVKHDQCPGLNLISAAQTRGSEAVSGVQMQRVIGQLRDRFDLIVIDCPAGVGRGFRNALSVADRAVVVSVPGAVELRDAERVYYLAKHMDLPSPWLALNRVKAQQMHDESLGPPAYLHRLDGARLIGLIPEADQGRVAADRDAQSALQVAARNLAGEDVEVKPVTRPPLVRRLARAIRG